MSEAALTALCAMLWAQILVSLWVAAVALQYGGTRINTIFAWSLWPLLLAAAGLTAWLVAS